MNMAYNLDQDRNFEYQNEESASSAGREKIQRKSQMSYARKGKPMLTTEFTVAATSGSLGNRCDASSRFRRLRSFEGGDRLIPGSSAGPTGTSVRPVFATGEEREVLEFAVCFASCSIGYRPFRKQAAKRLAPSRGQEALGATA